MIVADTDGQANLEGSLYSSNDYSFYTIIPEGFEFEKSTDLTKYPYIIDSGTTLMYLPQSRRLIVF